MTETALQTENSQVIQMPKVGVLVVDKHETTKRATRAIQRWACQPSAASEISRIASFCKDPQCEVTVRLKHAADSGFPGIAEKGIVGIERGGLDGWKLDLRVRAGASLSRLDWILWHELRHWEQKVNSVLESVVWGENRVRLFEALCDGRPFDQSAPDFNAALHTFHEIDPPEVDANIYACLHTGKEYRPNAWSIRPETILWFNAQKQQVREART